MFDTDDRLVPRVLPYEELAAYDGPVWVESTERYGYSGWALLSGEVAGGISTMQIVDGDAYRGKILRKRYRARPGKRCWTARPTEEDMRSVPW